MRSVCSPVGGDLNLQSHLHVQQVLVLPQQQSDLLLGHLQIQLIGLHTLLLQQDTTQQIYLRMTETCHIHPAV